jgi:hypothetical protein
MTLPDQDASLADGIVPIIGQVRHPRRPPTPSSAVLPRLASTAFGSSASVNPTSPHRRSRAPIQSDAVSSARRCPTGPKTTSPAPVSRSLAAASEVRRHPSISPGVNVTTKSRRPRISMAALSVVCMTYSSGADPALVLAVRVYHGWPATRVGSLGRFFNRSRRLVCPSGSRRRFCGTAKGASDRCASAQAWPLGGNLVRSNTPHFMNSQKQTLDQDDDLVGQHRGVRTP